MPIFIRTKDFKLWDLNKTKRFIDSVLQAKRDYITGLTLNIGCFLRSDWPELVRLVAECSALSKLTILADSEGRSRSIDEMAESAGFKALSKMSSVASGHRDHEANAAVLLFHRRVY